MSDPEKRLVALAAMLLAVEAGWQAALMAPTQILAEQHYLNFKRLLEPLEFPSPLRTADRNEDTAPLPLFALRRVGERTRPLVHFRRLPPESLRRDAGADAGRVCSPDHRRDACASV